MELIALALIVVLLYFSPAIAARFLKRKNTAAIFVLNFLLGWTILGWAAAAIWAMVEDN